MMNSVQRQFAFEPHDPKASAPTAKGLEWQRLPALWPPHSILAEAFRDLVEKQHSGPNRSAEILGARDRYPGWPLLEPIDAVRLGPLPGGRGHATADFDEASSRLRGHAL